MNMIDPSYRQDALQAGEAPTLDVKRLLRRAWRGLPIIVLGCLLGLAGGYVMLKKLQPKFASSASILIDPKQPGTYGADTGFSSALVDNSKVSSVEIVLQSSNLLRQVVTKLHLADNPYYGGLQQSRLSAMLQWITGRKPAAQNDTPQDREDRALGRLWKAVHPARIGATYVIKLDVTAPDPKDAAAIAGATATTYIDGLLNTKMEAARRDANWLTDRLKNQREELIKSETQVAAVQRKFGLVGSDAKDDTAVDRQSVAGVNQQMIGVEGDVAGIQSRYQAAMEVQRSGGDVQSLPDVASSPVIQDLQKKLAEATQRLAILSARYSRDFPSVKQASREVDAIRGMVAGETRRIIEGLKTQTATELARQNALSTEMNRLVGKVTATANAQGRAELQEAQRIAEANRVAYEASLTRLREVQEQESRLDVEARIISTPDLPEDPSFPRPIQLLPAGALLGLILGLGAVFALPMGKTKIETVGEVERDLLLQVLGAVPYLSGSDLKHHNRPISIPEYLRLFPFSAYAEAMRLLRYRMHDQKRAGGRVVQVTSSVPGEGKSTVAASLAISASTGHMRTVLIDLDLHRAGATRLLGGNAQAGVVDFLLGNASLDSAVHPVKNSALSVVGAGSFDTLRPGLLESNELLTLIAKLRSDYDLVIVDSPPVLAVSDSIFISRFVDSTMLVVAWRDTPLELIDKAANLLRGSGATMAGVLLNKVSQANRLTYGSENYGYHRVS